MRLALFGHETGQHARQPQRLLAQIRTRPVVARRGRMTFVKDQVDHLEHRIQALGTLARLRHVEGHLRLGEAALGAHDALRDGAFGLQEGARDLGRRQSAQQPQRERHACVGRQHRMTRGKDEAQQIVADVIGTARIQRVRDIGFDVGLHHFDLARQRLAAARLRGRLAQHVERAVAGGGHEPGARVGRHAARRPMLQRRHQGVLRGLFGQRQVAQMARGVGHHLGRLDAPDSLDLAADGVMIGHRYAAGATASGSM